MTLDKYLEDEGQTQEEFEADLERRVRDAVAAQFVLDEVASELELGVDQQELTEHMVRRAQQSGQDPQEFANHMFEHNHIPELVAEIRRGKALAQIVESATVTDASGNVVDLKNLRPTAPSVTRPRPRLPARPRAEADESEEPAPGLTPADRGRVVDPRRPASRIVRVTASRDPPPAAPPRLLDAAALLAEVADELLVRTVRDTHSRGPTACTGRPPAASGGRLARARAGPPRHRAGRVRRAGRGPAGGVPWSGRVGRARVGPASGGHRHGRIVSAAVNGLIGDRLAAERPRLAVPARRTP